MTPQGRIKHGTKFPYHNKPPKNKHEIAALGILADLLDRRGIKWELEQCDDDTKNEIVIKLAAILREALP